MTRVLLLATCSLALSCAPAYPRKITYKLRDDYGEAKGKIADYHRSREKRFHLFQDRINAGIKESRPGESSEFSLVRSAPDIGVIPVHRSRLYREQGKCTFEVIEIPNRRMIAEPSHAMDPLGVLEDIDRWASENLSIVSRELGEDRSKKPRNAAKDFFLGYHNDPLP